MVLIIVASNFSFYACGPSQAKLDAQATQVMEDHYATQTAAPTVTPTITLTPTPTQTATPTATIQPTDDDFLVEMNTWWAEYLKNIAEYAKGLKEFADWMQQDDKFKSMSPTELQDYLNLTMGSMIDNITILSNSNCPDVELQEAFESLYGETLTMSYKFNTAFETGDLDAFGDAFQNLLNALTQYIVVADKVKERFSD
jgi:hypothetical protein